MTPLFEKQGFVICFETLEEDVSIEKHLIEECGWTIDQVKEIEDCEFFKAKISAYKEGEEKATSFLGCCIYKNKSDFLKSEYFEDMVNEVIELAKL